MARQRGYGGSSFHADADQMADACYAPLLELARVQGLKLGTSQPITITGDWDLSIVPRFASTRVAPLRLPVGFENSLWRWPAIAHEVAHDFYYSLEGLEQSLHQRTGLPRDVEMPASSADVDGAWLRGLFGAWLPEIFADVFGTVSLGPAYVESMRRTFRNPGSPQQTAAILQNQNLMDEHPPPRLRLFMATRVLHHLGRHEEANDLWERWESDHPGVRLYYLPLGGQWVGLADETLHSVADSVIDAFVQRAWPELEGFHASEHPRLRLPARRARRSATTHARACTRRNGERRRTLDHGRSRARSNGTAVAARSDLGGGEAFDRRGRGRATGSQDKSSQPPIPHHRGKPGCIFETTERNPRGDCPGRSAHPVQVASLALTLALTPRLPRMWWGVVAGLEAWFGLVTPPAHPHP